MNKAIRVLVVDDSRTMRRMIRAVLESDQMITVVGEAHDAPTARDVIMSQQVDVITLDVEMPGMNGIDFLRRIMRHRPMPVIMVSSHTQKGAAATVEALACGAFACVAKPDMRSEQAPFHGLINMVHAATKANIHDRPASPRKSPVADFRCNGNIVAIGASIGGVEALSVILSEFPANCPPTLITQHMPQGFTRNFADRLDRLCAPKVREATNGTPIKAGHVYLAPGGNQHLKITLSSEPRCSLVEGPKVSGHSPSIDVLFQSCAKLGKRGVGVILTGMGKDGASGLLDMRNAGASTIGQSEDTCVVYGIAKTAHNLGAVEEHVALDDISKKILRKCSAVRPSSIERS